MKLNQVILYIVALGLIAFGIYTKATWVFMLGIFSLIEAMFGITAFIVNSVKKHLQAEIYEDAQKIADDNIKSFVIMLIVTGFVGLILYGLYTLIF